MKHPVFYHMSLIFNQKTLPISQNAHELFEHISSQPWAILLESGSKDHPDSRYNIITADPLATIETTGKQTVVKVGNQTTAYCTLPFNLLAKLQRDILGDIEQIETDLPFVGGAIGLMGYDLGRWIEKIPETASNDIDVPDLAAGIYDWAWILDQKTNQAHFVVCGDKTKFENRWQWWLRQSCSAEPAKQAFRLTSAWKSNLTQSEYGERFDAIQAYLKAGDCYQINLTQRFAATYEGDEWLAYKALSAVNQAPFSAFIRLENAALLSLSPERFLSLNHRHVETKPIKGTRPRHQDPIIDNNNKVALQNADKDRSENLMIVDLLRNDIGRVCSPGSVRVPKLFDIESFAAVHHMVSTITGSLADEYQATDLLAACFPGGSITGAPKVRAMEIIEELEPHRRNAYCGSIFYISQHGRMDSSITIRTLIACHQTMYVWAGGGIVADSKVDEEYQETFDKLGRILPILEMADHVE